MAAFDPVQVGEDWIISDKQTLVRVHMRIDCTLPCPIHGPSSHHLRDLPLSYRQDRKIFERVCEHGVGHPDPDTPEGVDTIHGCDGCCRA